MHVAVQLSQHQCWKYSACFFVENELITLRWLSSGPLLCSVTGLPVLFNHTLLPWTKSFICRFWNWVESVPHLCFSSVFCWLFWHLASPSSFQSICWQLQSESVGVLTGIALIRCVSLGRAYCSVLSLSNRRSGNFPGYPVLLWFPWSESCSFSCIKSLQLLLNLYMSVFILEMYECNNWFSS